MKPYGFVYLTTNLLNGMMYLGQTHYRETMREHYFGSGKAIKRAVKKNGTAAFKREVLFEAFSPEDLDWAERHFIAEHDAVASRRYYNITPGGRASLGFAGKKHTAERNAALSKKMRTTRPPVIAKSVTIDGCTFNSITAAVEATGFGRGKIERYLQSGEHPSTQQHRGRGLDRSNSRPSVRQIWCLTDVHGTTITVSKLKLWCAEHNIDYYKIRENFGRLYHGWILTRLSDPQSVPR